MNLQGVQNALTRQLLIIRHSYPTSIDNYHTYVVIRDYDLVSSNKLMI